MESEVNTVLSQFGYMFQVKDKQAEIIQSVIEGRDTFAVLPTACPCCCHVVGATCSVTGSELMHMHESQGVLVELIANCMRMVVSVRQIGSNPSAVEDQVLNKGGCVTAKQGELVYILAGLFPHVVRFQNKQQNSAAAADKSEVREQSKNNRKRTSSVQPENTPKKQKMIGSENGGGDDDEEHLKSVNEKLKKMKEMATKMSSSEQKLVTRDSDKNGKKNGSSGNMDKKHVSSTSESKWTHQDRLCIYTSKGVKSSEKVAGFDIDGTIITTKSGRVFPTHNGDWKILYSEIFGKLKKLNSSGYKIVFFTNQMGVQRGKVKIEELKEKFTFIVDKLGTPVQIFIATGSGIFRKPSSGMWQYMIKKCNDGIRVNLAESFYCGDAAGRPEKWAPGKKKDFSCGDRLFALNIGIKFYTPEEYFLDKKAAPFKIPDFDPKKLSTSGPVASPAGSSITSSSQEVVVLSGFPASGKSFFATRKMVPHGYVHVNRDTLGTWQKCVSECSKALAAGKSVVVDNTNPDAESRARYLECAKKSSVPCRCFVFTSDMNHIKHNERFREMTDKSHKPINEMILNSFKSKFKEPRLDEGFTEILKINFVPSFDSSGNEELYRQFLMEK